METQATAPLVFTYEEVAAALQVSVRKVEAMNAAGRLPSPIKFGRCVRWDREELVAWLRAGSPPRRKWFYRP